MAETNFKYDVFISYSHKDEEWVRNVLLPTLEKQALKVCIDYRDFIAGKPAIINMADASETSRHTLLVLTPRWVESEWTLYEGILSRTDDPVGLQRRTIPLLLEKCSPPKFISILSWVDFTNKTRDDEAWQSLFKALDKEVEVVKHESHSPYKIGWFFGHRYGDLATFTGRAAELKMLDEWLANDTDNLLLMTAFGGFGKSALAWTWFNRVDRAQWQTAVWWSFYEKESGFESFLSETLKHLGVEVKESARQQVNDLLEALRGTNILIVLDGFERLLRQYGRMDAALVSDDEDADIDPSQRDCSSPLTETFLRGLSGAGMKSKALMTTRLCPRALESADGKLLKGCRDESLSAFSPEDAVTYFHKEGIKATRAEIIAACAAYGYHPLSLSLLAGFINEDHEHRGDIAAVKNLEIFEDVRARRHHVLQRAYESLAPERRDLLSKISCFRGSMEYAVLKKVFPSPDLDKALLDLRKRGVLQYAGETQRYDMHPIVRHYAYDHLTEPERIKAHAHLRDYFLTIKIPTSQPQSLTDIFPLVELYHHEVMAKDYEEALIVLHEFLIPNPLHYQFGAYYLMIELLRALFSGDESVPSCVAHEPAQAWVLGSLATSYSLSGQPKLAIPLLETDIEILKKLEDKKGLAVTLGTIGMCQLSLGAIYDSEINLQTSLQLSLEIQDEFKEATTRHDLGDLLIFRGKLDEAAQEILKARSIIEKSGLVQVQTLGLNFAYSAKYFISIARSDPGLLKENSKLAIAGSTRALEIANITEQLKHRYETDFVRAYWLLGSAYRMNNELTLAEENLSKALNLCRQINLVDYEADILLDLARLRYAQNDFKDAQEKASEALVITERSGYVLQGADVNLFLATLALEDYKLEGLKVKSNEEAAIFHAKEALRLATCDGGEYTYKVAYEEAKAMLERLKV